jgi:hypothetical protein
MSSLDDHPTVPGLRAGGAQESTVEQNPLNSGSLRRIALECGADDCGLVRIDDPALGEERDHVLRPELQLGLLLAVRRRTFRYLPFKNLGHQGGKVVSKNAHRLGVDLADPGFG